MYGIGQVLNAVSMALTPQLISAGLGSWTIACNVVFSRCILLEVVGATRAFSIMGLMLAMLTMLLMSPSPEDKNVSMDSTAVVQLSIVIKRLLNPGFLIFTASLPFSFALLSAVAKKQRDGTFNSRIQLPLTMVAWSWAGAIAGSYTQMLVKCIADFFSAELKSSNPGGAQDGRSCGFGCWTFWILLAVAALAFGVAEIHLSNLAFKSGDMICAVPLYMSLEMILQLITGIIFFHEFRGFTSQIHMIIFLVSFALILLFLFLLANATVSSESKEPSSESRSPSREGILQLAIQPLQDPRELRLTS